MSQEVTGLEERVCDLVIHINLCVSFFRTSSVSSMQYCFITWLKIANMGACDAIFLSFVVRICSVRFMEYFERIDC